MGRVEVVCAGRRHSPQLLNWASPFPSIFHVGFNARFHLKNDPYGTRKMHNIASNKKDLKFNDQVPKSYKSEAHFRQNKWLVQGCE
jgi:hypothetical protein